MAEIGTGFRRCGGGVKRLSREYRLMQSEINDAALDYLLARAGLDLTEEQKAELKTVHAAFAAISREAALAGGADPGLSHPCARDRQGAARLCPPDRRTRIG